MANQDKSTSFNEKLIKAVSDNNLQEVVNIVSSYELNVNCVDEHGMSPLQHACYKGNAQISKFLIDQGADVNQNDHEHRYTALMFAALGGHAAVLNILLEHGANVSSLNSVGRNASQMAAFVGQHRSVAIINNFIARDYIEYYSKITGLEKQPRLSVRFIQPVHAFVRLVNVNPIRIIYYFKSNMSMFEEPKMISTVLDLLCEKLLRSNDPKEMFSLKVHYLSFMFKYVYNLHFNQLKGKQAIGNDNFLSQSHIESVLNGLIKSWLKPNLKGFPETMEKLLRQSIRQYPYQESSLFQQLVQTLSSVEIGDEPSALSILSQAILGKGIDGDSSLCFTCGESSPDKRCSKCKVATYCDHTCQKFHWHVHKRQCDQMALESTQHDQLASEVAHQENKYGSSEPDENESPNEIL